MAFYVGHTASGGTVAGGVSEENTLLIDQLRHWHRLRVGYVTRSAFCCAITIVIVRR